MSVLWPHFMFSNTHSPFTGTSTHSTLVNQCEYWWMDSSIADFMSGAVAFRIRKLEGAMKELQKRLEQLEEKNDARFFELIQLILSIC